MEFHEKLHATLFTFAQTVSKTYKSRRRHNFQLILADLFEVIILKF